MHSMDAIAALPGASFPRVFNKNKDLEGFYRLVENPIVKWRDVLSAHQDRTVERAQELKDVLILHDTTEVRFPLRELAPMRTNLGSLSTATQGFTPQAVPLGTLRIQPFIHKTEAPDEETMAFWNAEGGILDNERERWFTAVEATDAMVASASCSPIHVMDREADSYPMLAWLQGEDYRFVLRACHLNRSVQGSKSPLGAALDDQPFIAEATVPLGSRSPLRKASSAPRSFRRPDGRRYDRGQRRRVGPGERGACCLSTVSAPRSTRVALPGVRRSRDPPWLRQPESVPEPVNVLRHSGDHFL